MHMRQRGLGGSGADMPELLAWTRRFGLTLVVCIATMLCFFAPDGHNDQRSLQVVALLLAVPVFLGARFSGFTVILGNRLVLLSILSFFALGFASSVIAYSPHHAFLELSFFLLLLVLAMGIAGEIAAHGASGLTRVLNILAAGCLLYFLQNLLIYLAATTTRTQPVLGAFAPGFSNYRFLNHAQTILLPLLVLQCCRIPKGASARWPMYALTGGWWTLLLLSSGRGTMMGLAAGTLLALCLRRRHAFGFCKTMLLTALLGLAIYAVFFAFIPLLIGMHPFGMLQDVAARTASDPTSSRWGLWHRALDLMTAHPLLGVGPLHFAHYGIDVRIAAHPHDWVLQIGAEWGLPALCSVSGAIGLGLLGLLKTGHRIAPDDAQNQATLAAWIATGSAILIDGLVSGLIVMPVSQLLIALFIGCAAGWSWQFRHELAPQPPSFPVRAMAGSLILAALLVVVTTIQADIAKGGREGALNAAQAAWYDGNYYHPRIWVTGHF